jgi:hypothetical protein
MNASEPTMNLKILSDLAPWEWPDEAGAILQEVLGDRQAPPADRVLAADLAGELPEFDDDIADTLLGILRSEDEEEELRGYAAIAFGPSLEEADTDGLGDLSDLVISDDTLTRVRNTLRELYTNAEVPKLVRRRVLEAAVRAPQPWQRAAAGAAYASGDEEWQLTSVFCMRFLKGFDKQILEALRSSNEEIQHEAIIAAGTWELDAAWSHVVALVRSGSTNKPLLLAAIVAVASIRPEQAMEVLDRLASHEDDEIAEAVEEALQLAQGFGNDDEDF